MIMIQAEQDTVVDYAQTVSMRVIAASELIEVISDLTDTFVDTVNNGSKKSLSRDRHVAAELGRL